MRLSTHGYRGPHCAQETLQSQQRCAPQWEQGNGVCLCEGEGQWKLLTETVAGQVIRSAFVSLDFHRKKWKRLLGEKHSEALLFWPSKEGSLIGILEAAKEENGQVLIFTVHVCAGI